MKELQLHEAQERLSEVLDDAVRGEACVIIRDGKRETVLMSYAKWKDLLLVASFGRLL